MFEGYLIFDIFKTFFNQIETQYLIFKHRRHVRRQEPPGMMEITSIIIFFSSPSLRLL